jgi:hypothetical protein
MTDAGDSHATRHRDPDIPAVAGSRSPPGDGHARGQSMISGCGAVTLIVPNEREAEAMTGSARSSRTGRRVESPYGVAENLEEHR